SRIRMGTNFRDRVLRTECAMGARVFPVPLDMIAFQSLESVPLPKPSREAGGQPDDEQNNINVPPEGGKAGGGQDTSKASENSPQPLNILSVGCPGSAPDSQIQLIASIKLLSLMIEDADSVTHFRELIIRSLIRRYKQAMTPEGNGD